MPGRVVLRPGVVDQGNEACVIETPVATYWYHLTGGGFSRLLDTDGRDWISYRDGDGPGGEYRGIPNMVFRGPERGFLHPGHTGCRASCTEARQTGPDQVTLRSTSGDGLWLVQWDIYPRCARMQVLETDPHDPTYWLLYEGTPGGTFDPRASLCGRCTGETTPLTQAWDADLGDPAWVFFTDPERRRSLYLHAQCRRPCPAMYRPMAPMTVFGFGRRAKGVDACLTEPGASLHIGLVGSVKPLAVGRQIEANAQCPNRS
ncbi:hypothetical protein ACFL6X_02780 [Candidatus Latescibacterota bacterium]